MFGIGLPELILIMIVALLVVGPKKLPDLARSLGKAFNDFKRMTDDVKQTFEEEISEKEFQAEDDKGSEAEEDGKSVKENLDGQPQADLASNEASPDPSNKIHPGGYGDLRG